MPIASASRTSAPTSVPARKRANQVFMLRPVTRTGATPRGGYRFVNATARDEAVAVRKHA